MGIFINNKIHHNFLATTLSDAFCTPFVDTIFNAYNRFTEQNNVDIVIPILWERKVRPRE